MRTKAKLEQDIVNITMKIQTEFPELSKYLAEMPENGLGVATGKMSTKNFKEYYNSLWGLLLEYSNTHIAKNAQNGTEESNFIGYPLYPPTEDIYARGKKVMKLDPSDLSKNKAPNQKEGSMNEKDFAHDMSGDDLDVPGSEFDDQQESVGSEDEENNYYSIGGDKHNDLEEDTH
jgi:hypothetical protein